MRTFFILLAIVIATASCGRKTASENSGQRVLHGEGDLNIDGSIVHWKMYAERDSFFKTYTVDGKMTAIFLARSRAELDDSTFTRQDFSAGGKLIAEKSWIRGVPEGEWLSFHPDGKRASQSVIRKGVLHSYTAWYPNGKLQVDASRQPGGLMERTEYFDNGNPGQFFLADSLGNGTTKTWWRNGQPREEGKIIRFSPTGPWKRFDTLGKPLPDTVYTTGNLP